MKLLGPALANLHGQYNFQSISIALLVTKQILPQTGWEEALLTCVMFLGAIHGQLIFGYVGDWLGRRKATLITNVLSVCGALGSAVLPFGPSSQVYIIIALCRFVLGVGVGGTYPLSAVSAAEQSGTSAVHKRRVQVSWAFFWQVPGSALPYLVAYIVTRAVPDMASLQFRLILGLGALPAAAVAVLAYFDTESSEFENARAGIGRSGFYSTLKRREHWKLLAGTGLGWFCYDITHYGPYLLAPVLVRDIFAHAANNNNNYNYNYNYNYTNNDNMYNNSSMASMTSNDNISSVAWHTAVANLVGVPGVLVCILAFKPLGLKLQQFFGFLFIALTFVIMGTAYGHVSQGVLFAMFCLMTFAINSGPSVTTYVLPSETFPPEVRSSFNGLSAAMGKTGATLVTCFDFVVYEDLGMRGNLYIYATFAVLGAIVTWFFVEDSDSTVKYSKAKVITPDQQKAGNQKALKYTEFI